VRGGDPEAAKQISFGIGKGDGWNGLCWTQDGKIVYSSYASGTQELWVAEPDGSNQKQLTFESGQTNYGVSVSPDGRYIVFDSTKSGNPSPWRVNSDGSYPLQLANGKGGFSPFFSADGQWVFYETYASDGKLIKWKAPIDAGEPEEVVGQYWDILGVSHDGKLMAYWEHAEKPGGKRIGIVSSEGGSPVKIFDLPPTATMLRRMQWAADGRAIDYIDTRQDVSNI